MQAKDEYNASVEGNFTVTLNNANEPSTGTVIVSGTPVVGQTLTASNTLADPDGLGAITYQWYRDGYPIVYGGTLKDGVDGVDGLDGAGGVTLSADGNHAYVTGFLDDAVSWYERNSSTGALSYGGMLKDGVGGVDGLDGACSVTLSSDGNHAYVTGNDDNAVSWYERNSSTGALSYGGMLKDGVGGVDGLDGACSVTLSSDGNHAYVTGSNDNAVSWYERNSSTGALSYGGMLRDGVDGVDGLLGAQGITLSADGDHAYVTGAADAAVSWYERNASTGALSYGGMLRDAVGGVDGLLYAWNVTLSADGNHAYVTGVADDAVSWYERNASTGALSYLGMLKAWVGGVEGLDGARGVKLSSDGNHAYVTGLGDNAVSWYERNASTGALNYLGMLKDGVDGVDGLYFANSVTLSSDGKHAYVAGSDDDAVSWFTRNPVNGALSYGSATDANYTLTAADLGKTITVVASYTDGGAFDHNVSSVATLPVQSNNSIPTDLNSTAPLTIAENQPVGTVVGEFNATDLDAGATLTYLLVSGVGDTDNSLFTLEANGTLKTATTFDYETNASTYTIRVQVRDEYNATTEGNFSVVLTDWLDFSWKLASAGDYASGDHFGHPVAQSDDILAVGARLKDLAGISDAGAVYLYRLVRSEPVYLTKLTAPDAVQSGTFGTSISISENYLAVGAYESDVNVASTLYEGSVYIYKLESNGSVSFVSKIMEPDGGKGDLFGSSVSVDGDMLVVGAESSSPSGLMQAGAAYLYRIETNSTVTYLSKLTAFDQQAYAAFGCDVSQSNGRIAIGAYNARTGGTMYGAIYLYEVESNGSAAFLNKVVASDGAQWDSFGRSLSMSGDLLAVTADGVTVSGKSDAGAAYVYRLENNGTANLLDKLISPAPTAYGYFANDIAIKDNMLSIGHRNAVVDSVNGGGSVFLYRVEANESVSLIQEFSLASPMPMDGFGRSISVSRKNLIVGADTADIGTVAGAGQVYIFDLFGNFSLPASVDIQGEYVGKFSDGQKLGAQIIALDTAGQYYQTVLYPGGLPGDGWDESNKTLLDGNVVGDRIQFASYSSAGRAYMGSSPSVFSATQQNPPVGQQQISGELAGSLFRGTASGNRSFELEKLAVRENPYMGIDPSSDATVLFDGSNTAAFNGGVLDAQRKTISNNAQTISTIDSSFDDFYLHLEYKLPFRPDKRSQQRGNSGIFLLGKYEIQVLDSFGLEGLADEGGSIYAQAAPLVNASLAPETWQSYDIWFTNAKFDQSANKVANAKITVVHNGVTIHENLELTASNVPNQTEGGLVPFVFRGIPPIKLNFEIFGQ